MNPFKFSHGGSSDTRNLIVQTLGSVGKDGPMSLYFEKRHPTRNITRTVIHALAILLTLFLAV